MPHPIPFLRGALAASVISLAPALSAAPFVYQGSLGDQGRPANGRYDFQLQVLRTAQGVDALSPVLTVLDVPVNAGTFRIEADLPTPDGIERGWLAVSLRPAGGKAYAALPAREPVALATAAIGACWSSTGDSGSNPATNFLGTTDAQPLVLRVQNQQALRVEPSTVLSNTAPITANVVAGSAANVASVGARGVVISGGGMPAGDTDPNLQGEGPNRVTDAYGTVGGGWDNVAGDDAGSGTDRAAATVSGGRNNDASGESSVVGGGAFNLASGPSATVGGGSANQATADGAGVGGGGSNVAGGNYTTVAGGVSNQATAYAATVAGGEVNSATATDAFVGGGYQNVASGFGSSILGGDSNAAAGFKSSVPGGVQNCAGASYSFAAGYQAKVRPPADPGSGACSSLSSYPGGAGDQGTFVWADSQVGKFTSSGPNQFLLRAGGGVGINTATIPSISDLVVKGRNGGNADLYLQSGGGSIGFNLGASGTTAADAQLFFARYDGTTIADLARFTTTGVFQVYVSTPISPAGGSWAAASDRRLKHDIVPLTGALDRLLGLQGVTFEYNADIPAGYGLPGRRTGFVAQQVETVFPDWVGSDERGYKLVAPKGFEALAVEALRELHAEGNAQAERVAALERERDALSTRLAGLERAARAREATVDGLRAELDRLMAQLDRLGIDGTPAMAGVGAPGTATGR